ncbi:MAG: MogA/MoaB family molybdenum cofactor biosynthesis protein [Gemmatimonadota bacterium]
MTAWVGERGHRLHAHAVVPDEATAIAARITAWADGGDVDVVLTTGGTGFTRRDVTPEATRSLLERPVPGIAEAIRQRGAAATPNAWLSRGTAGIRGATLIVNLPGSTGGVRDGLAVLDGLIGHAVQLLRGIDTGQHPRSNG